MRWTTHRRASWGEALHVNELLVLPAAHNALTARLIERAGFEAYQIGGFALTGTMHAVPDVDLEHYGENSMAAREIIAASRLPVLVDADDGYGDAKNITRTVQGYEHMGASAIFIEDQLAPKKCGHMDNKRVVPTEIMEQKIKAAVAARQDPDFFILARTDALQPEGLDMALGRAERYLRAGADGIYIEGPTTPEELDRIGREFAGVPLATSVLEGGGKTPFLPPEEFLRMGFRMLLFPTTLLFQITKATERALADLRKGIPMAEEEGVSMKDFEDIVELPYWKNLEKKFEPSSPN